VAKKRIFHFYTAVVFAYWMIGWPSALGGDRTTFRDSEFAFRFVYPSAWQQKSPRGPNVRALIDAPDGMSSCVIVARREADLAKLSQREVDADLIAAPMSETDWKELFSNKYRDVKILAWGVTKVDNQPAQFAITEFSDTTDASTVHSVAMQFTTMTRGLFWHLGCMSGGFSAEAAEATFQRMQPTLNAILSSFTFETGTRANDAATRK
jgi:hypothetical protein